MLAEDFDTDNNLSMRKVVMIIAPCTEHLLHARYYAEYFSCTLALSINLWYYYYLFLIFADWFFSLRYSLSLGSSLVAFDRCKESWIYLLDQVMCHPLLAISAWTHCGSGSNSHSPHIQSCYVTWSGQLIRGVLILICHVGTNKATLVSNHKILVGWAIDRR